MTKEDLDRIDILTELIERYQETYYSGEGEISDEEFDLLWDELKKLSPDHPVLKRVGKDSTDGFQKVKHTIPMGSQEKASVPEEFIAWADKIKPESYMVQYKLDGASLELQYENGKLKNAVTRGDGIIGDNITANALRMKGVVKQITGDFTGGVRGEVIMTHNVWKGKYSDKANCRNAANGIMRRKDGSGSEDLIVICYDAAATEDDGFFINENEKISWLKKQGFNVTEIMCFTDPYDVIKYRQVISDRRKNLDFDIDGLVVKDINTDMTDLRRSKPERQIAFKFEPEIAYSILKDIEWSETGTTYTPIGILEPVRLAGTTVQRANLNNPGMIRAMGLKIGSAVRVVKRGEIIPKIEGLAPDGVLSENEKKEIALPDKCSSCNTVLVDTDTRLYCPNPACPKIIHHRLEKWISVLDIREIGEKLLKQLFDTGRVKSIPDLYTLTDEEVSQLDRMGDLSAAKVIRHINTKRQLSLAAFVAGFNLDGVGELIMEKVVSSGYDTLEKLRSANLEELANIHGLGKITAKIIYDGIKDTVVEMDNVLSTGIISILPPPKSDEIPLKGLSFCITGELKSMKRNKAEEKIKSLGGSVRSAVAKDLSYLVSNDPSSGSSKNKKALELGIKIIDEEAFLLLVGDKITDMNEEPVIQRELF